VRTRAETKQWFGRHDIPAGTVHFIGIGGAGMSAIARILLHQGRKVTGSDSVESGAVLDLRARGAEIQIGHVAANVANADVVIVSDAVDLKTNPEFIEAANRGIYLLKRSEALGAILRGKRTIAITGSHGKSTTTAILGQILVDAGLDPLVIVGADVPIFDRNVRFGSGDIAVVEACEAYGGIEDLEPESVLLVNLEQEHMDFHENLQNLRNMIANVANRATGEPKLIYCGQDSGSREVAEMVPHAASYDYSTLIDSQKMRIPGELNRLNASGAVAMAGAFGVSEEKAVESAQNAYPCDRRLQYIGCESGITVYDDYAHHPTEIRSSIQALRSRHPAARLVIAYQPHLYTRTQKHLEEFAPAFAEADLVVLTDIYPAREDPIPGISAALIVERLESLGKACAYVPSRHLLPRFLASIAEDGDVVVGMGAGNIESFAPDLLQELGRRNELRVCVMLAGESAEREVSICSGMMAADALRALGYQVLTCDPTEALLAKGDVSSLIGAGRPDVVFLALHGTGAEDGRIQGLLELLHLPFTGSGLRASALAMDKAATKRLLKDAGVPVPAGIIVRSVDALPDVPMPCVVKPNAQGSTIGLTFVHEASQLKSAVAKALKYDAEALVEEFVEGIEISVPVLCDKALPVVEICPASGSYDYASKYTVGATDEIVPARISESATKIAQEYALLAHRAIGAEDFSRTDMIVSDGRVVVLEINTLPGLTETSLLPRSAAAAGVAYADLCKCILLNAMERYGIKKS